MAYNRTKAEEKWQSRWAKSCLGVAEPDNRPKFFLVFAYPGVSGYLHVGHMRGFTYSDAICRYKRMMGYNVLFPVGSHATGNVSVTFAKKVRDGDPVWIKYLRDNGCPEGEIEKLGDVDEVVRFFNNVYVEDYWKKFGFLADWKRFATTTSPGYMRFIQWQFTKLHERGLLTQKPYYATFCPVCGPVAVDASETDISRGGGAEKQEYTLLKFSMDMGWDKTTFVLAATLRPETVFGQTNFWADPEVEYIQVEHGDEFWIMSRIAAEKLAYQIDGIKITGSVKGRELLGKECVAPGTERSIPILPANFCDPNVGTGLVTSVPSDAPVDWMALHDLQRNREMCESLGLEWERVKSIEPIPIICSKGYGPLPAVEICQRLDIQSQDDVEKLEEAKKEVYKIGFHTGIMMDNAGPYADMPVDRAKDAIREKLIEEGKAMTMHDLSEEVVCRCGEGVIVKRIDDQWFIRYSDSELTANSTGAVENMNIKPKDFKNNLPGILEWFQDRACVRMGSWLGTRFPLDEKWIIEPISDSTLYPIYYLVSGYVNSGEIGENNLVPDFFDHVFLGEGEASAVSQKTGVPMETLCRIKNDVEYWYPLDINLGGKEHMTVHFPVFLMNHTAILPRDMWPQGIFAHWYIIGKGSKISKSKGGAEPIPDAVKHYGVDAMRLFYCNSGSPFVDVEWDEELVANYGNRMEKLFSLVEQTRDIRGDPGVMDPWLKSRLSTITSAVKEAMEDFNLRNATNAVYFELPADIKWYIKRGGCSKNILQEASRTMALLMTPFTPHIAEEIWEFLGGEGLASEHPFPEEETPDVKATASEEYVRSIMDDIASILKVTGVSPQRMILYTSPGWKHDINRMIEEALAGGDASPGPIIKKVMDQRPELKPLGKSVSQYVAKTIQDFRKKPPHPRMDEVDIIREAIPFLENEYDCTIEVHGADEGAEDPGGKSKHAAPGRPAIYIE